MRAAVTSPMSLRANQTSIAIRHCRAEDVRMAVVAIVGIAGGAAVVAAADGVVGATDVAVMAEVMVATADMVAEEGTNPLRFSTPRAQGMI